MNLDHVQLIREVMVLDRRGRKTSRIQVSDNRLSDLKPIFRTVPRPYESEVRELYLALGGGRLKEWWVGLTVVLQHPS